MSSLKKLKGAGGEMPILERLKEMPQRVKDAPPKQYAKVGVGLVLGGIGFGWLAFPYILDFAVAKMVNLNEGNDVRKAWKRVPQHFDFNVYIFNVTNPTEVQNGGVPQLQEIGPYRYKEWKEKVNLFDDDTEDTITYSPLSTWYFLKDKSYPLTGDELVTLPHLPVLSVLLVAEQDFPIPMMTVVNAAVPKIYGKLDSVFLTSRVRDLLFDGVLIDCSSKEIVPKTVCLAIKQNSKPLVKLGNNKYLFSFFGVRNGTPEEIRITVKKGVRDVYEIGKVVAVNGRPENFAYPEGECSKLVGTDSTIFPPFRRPDNTSIYAFSPEICRAMTGIYEGPGEYQGVRGHKYTVSLGDMKRNPGEACYCNRKCLDKGAVDLTKCVGAPIIATLPHFYDSDVKYQNGVKGLNPDKQRHELTFIMEPTSGVPLLARKRIQFNIDLHPIRYVDLTRKLRPTLLPIFWLEENLDLGEELMGFLEANLLTNLRLVDFFKWALIVLGLGVCVGGVVTHRMRKEAAKKKGSAEDLLGAEVLEPSRLSLDGADSSSSSSGHRGKSSRRVAPSRQPMDVESWTQESPPRRKMTGVGWSPPLSSTSKAPSPPQTSQVWGAKMTPIETLSGAVAASAPPLPSSTSNKAKDLQSGKSVGKLGSYY